MLKCFKFVPIVNVSSTAKWKYLYVYVYNMQSCKAFEFKYLNIDIQKYF